ncbi:MAG: hypothetical protein FWD36_07585 [Treponema sp.]|nr:hypothetical protein [Treponema sp.]
MKKKLMFGAILALILTGCVSTNMISKENRGTFPVLTSIPAKDFITLGMVFTENVVENGRGHVFTYQALLKEAHKLGADTIINVAIDIKHESAISMTRRNDKGTWYGSAVAIKYATGTLNDTTTVTAGSNVVVTKSVIMNGQGGVAESAPSSAQIQVSDKNVAARANNWVSGDLSIFGIGARYERMFTDKVSLGATFFYNYNLFDFWGVYAQNAVGGDINMRLYPGGRKFYFEFGLLGTGFMSGYREEWRYEPDYYNGYYWTGGGDVWEVKRYEGSGYMTSFGIGWKVDVGEPNKFFLNPFFNIPMVFNTGDGFFAASIRMGMGIGYAF